MTRVPFSYIIESVDGDIYIGSRYGVSCHPSQLLVSYFTSSKYVKPLILKDPNKWKIVRLVACASTQETVNLECEWQMEFIHYSGLMNRRLNNGKFISHGPKSDETRRKISESRRAMKIVPSQETREKLRLSSTGRTLSDASREKLSRSKIGQRQSPEVRGRISRSLTQTLKGGNNPNSGHWVLKNPEGNVFSQPPSMAGREWVESLGLSYQYLMKSLKSEVWPTAGKLVGWEVLSRQKRSK